MAGGCPQARVIGTHGTAAGHWLGTRALISSGPPTKGRRHEVGGRDLTRPGSCSWRVVDSCLAPGALGLYPWMTGFTPLAEQWEEVREALIESPVLAAEAQEMSPPSTRDPGARSGMRVLGLERAGLVCIQHTAPEPTTERWERPGAGACVCLRSETQTQQVANGPLVLSPAAGGSDAR